jgi:hypothetical protein
LVYPLLSLESSTREEKSPSLEALFASTVHRGCGRPYLDYEEEDTPRQNQLLGVAQLFGKESLPKIGSIIKTR